jgi:hypothetical protein
MIFNPSFLAFVFRHAIENANSSSGIGKRLAAARTFGGVFLLALAGMLDEFNSTVASIGYAAPFLGHHVHRVVIVFGNFVTRYIGINDHNIDAPFNDLPHHAFDHRAANRRAGA